jgi:hypothetical protein
MTIHHNNNLGPNIAGLMRDHASREADMAAFDRLGPRTRAAIQNMVVPWSATRTLETIESKWGADPNDRQIDYSMSRLINQINDRVWAGFRKLQSR